MTFANNNDWQITAGVTAVAAIASLAVWLVMRRRPTTEQIEHARRQFLVQSGRLVDGMLLDVYDVEGDGGQKQTFLLFNYRIAGVDYECSQEITAMRGFVDGRRSARRVSLHRALPARQPAQQHRHRRGLDRPARKTAAIPRLRRPGPHRSQPSGTPRPLG